MVISNRKWRREINFIRNFTFEIKLIKEFFSLWCVLRNQHELRHWQPIRVDQCWFGSISFELLQHSPVDLYLGASPRNLAFYVLQLSVESIGSIIWYGSANRADSGDIQCFVREFDSLRIRFFNFQPIFENALVVLIGIFLYTYSSAHAQVKKWIFDLQFPGSWFEFDITLSDFWSSVIWAINF